MKKSRKLHSPEDPQELPHRFLFRQGKDFYRFADLQVLDEPNDRLSLFLKPPIESLYVSRKPDAKIALPKSGILDINVSNDITKGLSCFNPYLSWHSSGKSHVNAYSTKDLEREKVLKDSSSVSISDIVVPPHIIFTAIFPISTLSHIKTGPPPTDFDGNYIEVSSKPHKDNVTDKATPVHYVLDMAELRPGSIVMDVMVHNRGSNVDIEKNHPYPNNSEMFFVAQPLKIMPRNSLCPAVTVFFYQPIYSEPPIIKKQPSTLWARSKGASQDLFVQYEPI